MCIMTTVANFHLERQTHVIWLCVYLQTIRTCCRPYVLEAGNSGAKNGAWIWLLQWPVFKCPKWCTALRLLELALSVIHMQTSSALQSLVKFLAQLLSHEPSSLYKMIPTKRFSFQYCNKSAMEQPKLVNPEAEAIVLKLLLFLL